MIGPLSSWRALNDFLRDSKEEETKALLEKERKGRKRAVYLRRIHNRYNKLRMWRERLELMK